ncbi:MAG TPA: Tim44-like domain-containing protein [Candidatus Eremiobacteraceae bacterium]|nr:Tim44-like domain-containing protein [Candidatus Eremiobacteraceae bacterium]
MKRFRSFAFAAIAYALTVALPVAALARAGGGQGYGGGGGGGGFGGDDYGGLWSLWPLLFLGHGSGFGGIIFFLIILWIISRRSRAMAMSFSAGAPDPGNSATAVAEPYIPPRSFDQTAVDAGLGAIKLRDPNFDERAFLDRAQTAFFKLQQAWTARNQDLARDVMSDALYERHKMQTDQLISAHQIDVLENIVIGSARIVEAHPGTAYDSIAVAFTASMTDYTIDEHTKQVVSGDRYQQTFTEIWTFIRRADARSVVGATAMASTCPNCGAPLHTTGGKCDYCGSYARTSSSDWVVDTIEQTN